jgi:hypothetical protein
MKIFNFLHTKKKISGPFMLQINSFSQNFQNESKFRHFEFEQESVFRCIVCSFHIIISPGKFVTEVCALRYVVRQIQLTVTVSC